MEREHLESIKDSLYNPIGNLLNYGEMMAPGFHYAGTTDGVYAGTDYRSWNYVCDTLKDNVIRIRLNQLPLVSAEESRKRSENWWYIYWQTSFIELGTKDKAAQTMVHNYELMRYMLGCNAYGEWPTKFNGGLFTFDPIFVDSTATFTPDYR